MFNTGNDVPSNAFRDLSDNAEGLDRALNSAENTFQNRIGQTRLTFAGMSSAAGDATIAIQAAESALTEADRATAAADSVEANATAIAAEAVSNVVAAVDGAVAQAEAARDASLLSKGVWPTTAAGIGQGVAGTSALVAGSGGTDGTFDLAFSGGTQVLAPKGRFVVQGGAVTQVIIDYPGYYSAGTPTISFAESSGLTGASVSAVMGPNTPVGSYFSTPGLTNDDFSARYRVDPGPVATPEGEVLSSSGVKSLTTNVTEAQVAQQNRRASYPWLSSLLVVGDSRAAEGRFLWKNGSAASSTLPLRDVRGGYLNPENQSGTLEYDYRDEDPHVRWKALGDSFGPWTPVRAGLNYAESGTPGEALRLRFALYTTDTLPAGTETVSVLLTGGARYGYAAIGCINRALHMLRWPFTRVRNVAIGGNSSVSVLPQIESMKWEAAGSGGAAIVMLGTNDISGVTTLETITQNLAELYDSLAGLGLRLIIIEEHARWGSSAVSPMSVSQLERFDGVRAFQRKYAHRNGHLFVATYDATKDPAHSDGRPAAGVLRDTVHPSEYGSALIGGLIAEKVSAWVGLGPVARETDPNQLGIGYFKSGGGIVGTGVTGDVPAGWQLRRSLGSDAVATASLEAKDGSLKWLRCLMSATTAGRILLTQYFEDITLEELGLSPGDKIYAELEYRYRDVVNVTRVEVLFRFAGQPITTELVPFTGESGPIVDESGIYRSPVVAIPDATTGINLFLTVRLDPEGSADISFANIAIRKYLL